MTPSPSHPKEWGCYLRPFTGADFSIAALTGAAARVGRAGGRAGCIMTGPRARRRNAGGSLA
jgi:hypothetical protein